MVPEKENTLIPAEIIFASSDIRVKEKRKRIVVNDLGWPIHAERRPPQHSCTPSPRKEYSAHIY